MRIAQIIPCTEAEGPGRRFAIWFQGCPLRCPNCCNPEMLPFEGGKQIALSDILRQIRGSTEEHNIEGITLLGGDPLAHAQVAAALASAARKIDLTVMVFTGYTIEEVQAMPDRAVSDLIANTDILVDGPYLRELPDTNRRWIGSTNQRIHFLTERYSADDSCWRRPNTIEIRLQVNEIAVNGFPSPSAKGIWQRLEAAP